MEQSPSNSIVHLAEILDSTDSTVYRYFDLIRVCGFDLQRDEHKRFHIVDERTNGSFYPKGSPIKNPKHRLIKRIRQMYFIFNY